MSISIENGAHTRIGLENSGSLENNFDNLQQAQIDAQEEFIAFQVASQNQNLQFEAKREAVQQIETTTEAAFDEAEKYRANIAAAQA